MGTIWFLFFRRRKVIQRGFVVRLLLYSQLVIWREFVVYFSILSFSFLDNDRERVGCFCGNLRRLFGGGCIKFGLRMLDFRVWREGEEGAVVEVEFGSQGRVRFLSFVKFIQSFVFFFGYRISFMFDLCLKILIFFFQLVDFVFYCIKTVFCNFRCGGFFFLVFCVQRLSVLFISSLEWLLGVCGWLEEFGGGEFFRRFFLFFWSKGIFLFFISSSVMIGFVGAVLIFL